MKSNVWRDLEKEQKQNSLRLWALINRRAVSTAAAKKIEAYMASKKGELPTFFGWIKKTVQKFGFGGIEDVSDEREVYAFVVGSKSCERNMCTIRSCGIVANVIVKEEPFGDIFELADLIVCDN